MKKKATEFPFESARRITEQEVLEAQAAVREQFGIETPKRGRPPNGRKGQSEHVSIRLHPKVIEWAKEEGKKRGIGYQTVINEELLRLAVSPNEKGDHGSDRPS